MNSNILTMIEQAEVEWKSIEEVFNIRNGYTPSKTNKAYWENGTIPWFRMEDIRENGRKLHSSLQKITESAVKGGKLFPANSIIIATSATIGEHALITVPYLANQRFTNLSLKPEYEDKLDMEFIFHYCFSLNDWCKKNTTMSSFASVDMVGFRKYPIPIPPLELQKEIVKRLDILTELEATLEATLEAELSLRKKQYQYYRDLLLTFDDISDRGGYKTNPFFSKDVVWKSLGEVAQIVDGTHQTPKYTLSGIPFISVENIRNLKGTTKYISENDFEKYKIKPQKGDVFMTRIGDIGTCAVIENNEPLAYYVTLSLIRVDKYFLNPKYLKFFIESGLGKAELYKRTLIHAIPIKINLGDIGKIQIPIPPLETQAKIVAILDKFDRLTNSITDGLPKEIELRRKQYEYYRELLLGFARV